MNWLETRRITPACALMKHDSRNLISRKCCFNVVAVDDDDEQRQRAVKKEEKHFLIEQKYQLQPRIGKA